MTTDFRTLCAELADALDNATRIIYCEDGTLHISTAKPVLTRARAALAEPQPPADGEVAEPSDEDLDSFLVDVAAQNGDIYWADPKVLARAVLARWRTSNLTETRSLLEPIPVAEQPSEQEFLDLAAKAIDPYTSCGISSGEYEAETECAVHVYGSELIAFARAVLARWGTATPQPIPVAERLPEAGDCDSSLCWQMVSIADINGRCMMGRWELRHRNWLSDPDADGVATHWLPAHALPLPSGEVDHA